MESTHIHCTIAQVNFKSLEIHLVVALETILIHRVLQEWEPTILFIGALGNEAGFLSKQQSFVHVSVCNLKFSRHNTLLQFPVSMRCCKTLDQKRAGLR